MIYKTDAVVLRKNKISEADVILTLFTRKLGKIRAVAKGGRKPKASLSPASHIFVFGEFVLVKGKELDRISSADIHESFYSIREDLSKLAYASYFAELCDTVTVEGVTNNRLFDTFLKALSLITHVEDNFELIKLAFQLKLLDYSGFRPELTKCIECNGKKFKKIRFNIEQGGIICDNCFNKSKGNVILIDLTMVKIMRYILKTDIITISKIKLNPLTINRLSYIIDKYILFHLQRKSFKSLEFLNTIKKI
ncbi:DNA repair protein RecO [Maledivibacter halophilus]|uniref:DNA repair protein RecO n=1 Tax=Maledivibacter halophilus TaxID=36842 RepID=A0A1T5LVD4_9FIRM|nr:DNA repair protein RecO [Maledivibacter halophilus]SKC79538.1 DNA replication and repair protein RecO [Maledivibacter halophilus]